MAVVGRPIPLPSFNCFPFSTERFLDCDDVRQLIAFHIPHGNRQTFDLKIRPQREMELNRSRSSIMSVFCCNERFFPVVFLFLMIGVIQPGFYEFISVFRFRFVLKGSNYIGYKTKIAYVARLAQYQFSERGIWKFGRKTTRRGRRGVRCRTKCGLHSRPRDTIHTQRDCDSVS